MIKVTTHPVSGRLMGILKMPRLVSKKYALRHLQRGTLPFHIVLDWGVNRYDTVKLTVSPSIAVNPPAIGYYSGIQRDFGPYREKDSRLEQLIHALMEDLRPCTIHLERQVIRGLFTIMFQKMCRKDAIMNRSHYVA